MISLRSRPPIRPRFRPRFPITRRTKKWKRWNLGSRRVENFRGESRDNGGDAAKWKTMAWPTRKYRKEGMELRRGSEREKLAGRPRRRNEVHKDEREWRLKGVDGRRKEDVVYEEKGGQGRWKVEGVAKLPRAALCVGPEGCKHLISHSNSVAQSDPLLLKRHIKRDGPFFFRTKGAVDAGDETWTHPRSIVPSKCRK